MNWREPKAIYLPLATLLALSVPYYVLRGQGLAFTALAVAAIASSGVLFVISRRLSRGARLTRLDVVLRFLAGGALAPLVVGVTLTLVGVIRAVLDGAFGLNQTAELTFGGLMFVAMIVATGWAFALPWSLFAGLVYAFVAFSRPAPAPRP